MDNSSGKALLETRQPQSWDLYALKQAGLAKEVQLVQTTKAAKFMSRYPEIDVTLRFASRNWNNEYWFHKTSPIIGHESEIKANRVISEREFLSALCLMKETTTQMFKARKLPLKKVGQGMFLLNSDHNFDADPNVYSNHACISELLLDFIRLDLSSERIVTYIKYGFTLTEADELRNLPLSWIQKMNHLGLPYSG